MSKGSKAKFAFTEGQDAPRASRVGRVQELRRSGAAGAQDHAPRRERSRSAGKRAAIARGY
jgi:hypothetical protein